MSISYSFDYNGDTLIVKAKGFDDSLDDVINYNSAVEKEAIRAECNKIICDERELEYKLNVSDTYELAKFMSEKIQRDFRIAIITLEENKDIVEFWENVSSNRGIQVRVFFKMDDGFKWLNLKKH